MEKEMKGEVLIKSLDNVMRMLTYAEAKNGLLVSFYLVVISLVKFLFNPNFLEFKYVLGMLPVYTGLIIVLVSFFPIISNVKISKTIIERRKNYYFFGDLADCTTQELREVYAIEENDEVYLSIVNQTIINSKITKRKFSLFKLSIYIFFIIPVLIWIIQILFNKFKELVKL